MIADIRTVVWKEWKELFFQRAQLRAGWLGIAMIIVVFGVFMPLQMGRVWVESPWVLFYWLWVPLFLVSNVVADSFAGERERHTLEALLSTRLPDRAILFGKLIAAIGYGWEITLTSIFLGVVTINLRYRGGGWLIYSPEVGIGIVALSLLSAGFIASAGVLISLRASSVRQAQQTMSISIMLLIFIPIFGAQALPLEWRKRLVEALMNAGVTRIMFIVMAALIVLSVGLLAVAMARFKRARLILDFTLSLPIRATG
jgi:ABC-2 type transport system permease protein